MFFRFTISWIFIKYRCHGKCRINIAFTIKMHQRMNHTYIFQFPPKPRLFQNPYFLFETHLYNMCFSYVFICLSNKKTIQFWRLYIWNVSYYFRFTKNDQHRQRVFWSRNTRYMYNKNDFIIIDLYITYSVYLVEKNILFKFVNL